MNETVGRSFENSCEVLLVKPTNMYYNGIKVMFSIWQYKLPFFLMQVPEDSNPSSAVEEILDQPERLKDLDLDAFAEELARQGYGNKQITLYDIRDELINRFKDHRVQFKGFIYSLFFVSLVSVF